MNLLYAIYDKGYKANVILGFERSPKINEILNVDENLRPDFLIPFGSSEESGQASFRFDLEDVFEIR
jgi:nitroreductase